MAKTVSEPPAGTYIDLAERKLKFILQVLMSAGSPVTDGMKKFDINGIIEKMPGMPERIRIEQLRTNYATIKNFLPEAKKAFESFEAHLASHDPETLKKVSEHVKHIANWFHELEQFEAKVFQPDKRSAQQEAMHMTKSVRLMLDELELILHALSSSPERGLHAAA